MAGLSEQTRARLAEGFDPARWRAMTPGITHAMARAAAACTALGQALRDDAQQAAAAACQHDLTTRPAPPERPTP